MRYCVNCGVELVTNAKFCQKCGCPTGRQNNYATRKQEFAGKIYKCPNCGEVLKSFEINCPACGHELRGTKASSSVREFALKLEAIEFRREYERPRGLLGLFTNAKTQKQIPKTDKQKISLIRSFAVPNSKEDMLEFMILATSNMNMRPYKSIIADVPESEKAINAAWFSKMKQIYEKAKRSHSTDDVFAEIKALYDGCNAEIKKAKMKKILVIALIIGCIPLFGVIFAFTGTTDEDEIERLENIVIEVQEALDKEEYKHALRIAESIDYQLYDDELERKWDIQRAYWIDKVIEEAAKEGFNLEYTSLPNVDTDSKGGIESFKKGFQSGFNSAVEDYNETRRTIYNKKIND